MRAVGHVRELTARRSRAGRNRANEKDSVKYMAATLWKLSLVGSQKADGVEPRCWLHR